MSKYYNFLQEESDEDILRKALHIDEPQVGKKYAPEKVERYLKYIDDALSVMKDKENNDENDAIVEDLRDKKIKWENVDKETKPVKTKLEVPPKGDEEEEQQQTPPQEQPRENKLKNFLNTGGTLDESNLLGLL